MDRIREALAPMYVINVVIQYERWMQRNLLAPGSVRRADTGVWSGRLPRGRVMRWLRNRFSTASPGAQRPAGIPGGQGAQGRGNRPRTLMRGPRQRRRGPYDGGSGSGGQGDQ